MKKTQTLLSVLLCVAMIVTYMPVTAFAEEAAQAPASAPVADEAQTEKAETPDAENTDSVAEEPEIEAEAAEETVEEVVEDAVAEAEESEAAEKPAADKEAKAEAGKEEKAYDVTYEATCDGIRVTAKAKSNVLPKGAMLKVKRVSNAYGASLLNNSNIEYDGFVAMDIYFVADGREVEPKGNVKVTAQVANSLIGDDADMDTLQMIHFENDSSAKVVDSSVSVSGSKAIAGFTVDSFSVFTLIHWHPWPLPNGEMKIQCVDTRGNGIGSDYSLQIGGVADWEQFNKLAQTIPGYKLSKVTFGGLTGKDYQDYYVRHITATGIWGAGWRYCADDNWYNFGDDLAAEGQVYFVYESDKTYVTATILKEGWNDAEDADGIRPPSVTVRLLADGKDTGKTVTLDSSNTWTSTFYDVDIYDAGNKIKYTVEEVKDTVITGKDGSGTYADSYAYETGDVVLCKITNTHTPEKRDIAVQVSNWNDNSDQDGCRPASVTVKLLANGDATGKTATLDNNNQWATSFTGVNKNKAGQEITYTVEEVKDNVITGTDGPGTYAYSVAGDAAQGFEFTNTHTPETRAISVTKDWQDNFDQDGCRPASVTVKLLADGVDTGETVVLDNNNRWAGSFLKLDKYKGGKLINYTVEEVMTAVIDGNDAPGTYSVAISGDADKGFVVTNTHTPEVITVAGIKTWDDISDIEGLRPSSITVNLEASIRGDKIDVTSFGQQASQVVKPDAQGNWTYSWVGLPKYDEGDEIQYTVTENPVQYYDTTYNGFDITNKIQASMRSIYAVTYEFKSATPGKTLPAEIFNSTPVDPAIYRDKTEITADAKSFPHTYKVEGGKWVFKGYRSGANGAYSDPEVTSQTINKGDIWFVGYWVFEEDPASEDDSRKGVDTGDSNNILPSALLMVLAAGGIAVIRRKREDENR